MPIVTDSPQMITPQKVVGNGNVIKTKEDEKEKKKRRTAIKLTSDLLFSDNGLKKLKKDFNPQARSLGTKGQEAEDLKKVMALYEDWAYKLCPIPFDEFINQAEKLCGTMAAKDYLKRLEDGDAVFTTASVDQNDLDFMVPDENTEPNVLSSMNNNTPSVSVSMTAPSTNALTVEQAERIERNKQIALEKKRQREQEAKRLEDLQAPSQSSSLIDDEPVPFDEDDM